METRVPPLPPGYRPLVLAGVEKFPRMAAKCHDCAFHPKGSPEQDNRGAWFSILNGVDRGKPFFCHQGMPMDGDRYAPPTLADGSPAGEFRICAGWVEMREKFLAVRRADLLDDLRAAPRENPVLWDVVDTAIRATFGRPVSL